MNKSIKSKLFTSIVSVITTIAILFLYGEFTGKQIFFKEKALPIIDTIKVTKNKSTILDNKIKIANLIERQRCLTELLINEQEGVILTNSCGSTSGIIGNSIVSNNIKIKIEQVDQKIDSLISLLKEN